MFRSILLSTLTFLIFQPSSFAFADECNQNTIKKWILTLENPPEETAPRLEFQQYQLKLSTEKNILANELFKSFIANAHIQPCLDLIDSISDDEARGSLQDTISASFFQGSLDFFSASGAEPLKLLSKLVQEEKSKNNLIRLELFNKKTKQDNNIDSVLLGAYDRRNNNIIMNLRNLDVNSWFITFIHEAIHSLDEKLKFSSKILSNPKLNDDVITLIYLQSIGDPQVFLPEDAEQIDLFLDAGLNCGLLAEYRAWLLTLMLYQEGLNKSLWERDIRLEFFLKTLDTSKPFPQQVLHGLNLRFFLPKDGVFSFEYPKKRTQMLINGYLNTQSPPPLPKTLNYLFDSFFNMQNL